MNTFHDTERLAPEVALQRLDGDMELLRTLYAAFCQDAPLRLESLQQAMDAQNMPVVQNQAHALKGAASIIGALRCAQLAATLEKAAAARREGQGELLGLLQQETQQLLAELQSPLGQAVA